MLLIEGVKHPRGSVPDHCCSEEQTHHNSKFALVTHSLNTLFKL